MEIIAAEESEGECSHICVFIPCSDITSEIQDLEVLTSGGVIEEDISLQLCFLQGQEQFSVPYLILSNPSGVRHNVRKNPAEVKKGRL